MSLFITDRPSQGAETIKLSTVFLEDSTQAGLQAKIDALSNLPVISTAGPQGSRWMADIQYRVASGGAPPIINYSVMFVIGEWNPT